MIFKFFNCEDACLACDKAQYEEAKFTEKLWVRLHGFICKKCRKYNQENRELTQRLNSKITKLSKEEKLKLQRKLEAEMKNQ